MLTISDTAYAALEFAHFERQVRRIARHFVERSGRRTPPPQIENRLINTAISAANGYGIKGSRACGMFAGFALVVGPDFHLHPQCQAVLQDTRVSPEGRIDDLMRPALRSLWAELATNGPRG